MSGVCGYFRAMEIGERKSKIRFGLLARGEVVLSDCNLNGGTYELACQSALKAACSDLVETQHSYDYGEKISIHVYTSKELCYLCVTDRLFEKTVAFDCLFALERELHNTGLQERALIAGPYALRSSFRPAMTSTLTQYSSSDKLGRLEDRVQDVTYVMKDNIKKVADRGDALDDLQSRSDSLAFSSRDFRQSSTKLSRKLFWDNIKRWIIICIILGIIFLVIVVIILIVLGSQGVFDKH